MYFSWKKVLSLSRCGSAQEEMETGISSGSFATRNPQWLKLVPLCKIMMAVTRMEMVPVNLEKKK